MPTSVVLPRAHELALEALIGCGSYKTQSEILRVALEEFLRRTPQPTLVAAAVWAHSNGLASISQAAALAGIGHAQMHGILVREGNLQGDIPEADVKAEAPCLSTQAKPSKRRRAS